MWRSLRAEGEGPLTRSISEGKFFRVSRSSSRSWDWALGLSESNVVAERTLEIEWACLLIVNGEHQIRRRRRSFGALVFFVFFWWSLFQLFVETQRVTLSFSDKTEAMETLGPVLFYFRKEAYLAKLVNIVQISNTHFFSGSHTLAYVDSFRSEETPSL